MDAEVVEQIVPFLKYSPALEIVFIAAERALMAAWFVVDELELGEVFRVWDGDAALKMAQIDFAAGFQVEFSVFRLSKLESHSLNELLIVVFNIFILFLTSIIFYLYRLGSDFRFLKRR